MSLFCLLRQNILTLNFYFSNVIKQTFTLTIVIISWLRLMLALLIDVLIINSQVIIFLIIKLNSISKCINNE